MSTDGSLLLSKNKLPKSIVEEGKNMSIGTRTVTDKEYAEKVFQILAANTYRTKISFTNVFIGIHPSSSLFLQKDSQVERKGFRNTQQFIESNIRQSDILFPLTDQQGWLLMLSATGEREAIAFLERLFGNGPLQITEQKQVLLSASIIEVGNSQVTFKELMEVGSASISSVYKKEPFQYVVHTRYKEREKETIKVSILEEDEIMKQPLKSIMERVSGEHFHIEMKVFSDGATFLDSTWYQSGETHIVILNDTLKKRNGIEVLHELRNMPNDKKYIIIMLSKRRMEQDMLYSYEQGVDEYIYKPFNVRLLEAKIKRLLRRLRL